ncbi:hypothetical protein niasHT_038906 [Heterodera trifolii]|uniref:Spartan-like zinc binding domain-containing protein n=1 Tax=Heterodera trifolii TaxID=157864 RepID=A0ABD2IK21_9BILA
MIHAYLMITDQDDGHGDNFVRECRRLNAATGAAITKYHAFHDEVLYYRRNIWRCNGPCRERGPTYGQHEQWWIQHVMECGGGFIRQPWTGNVQTDNF